MKYVVTHTLNADELEPHIAKIGGLKNVTIDIIPDYAAKATPADRSPTRGVSMIMPPKPRLVRGPRKRGGSSVNLTVLTAMQHGPQTTQALKEALTAAGNSAGSLSTALAQLQKSGKIERVSPGMYQLSLLTQAAE